jgi:hypothetical protein
MMNGPTKISPVEILSLMLLFPPLRLQLVPRQKPAQKVLQPALVPGTPGSRQRRIIEKGCSFLHTPRED